MFKAELDKVIKRKREHTNNMFKAYAKLWERCNKVLKVLIEVRIDFETKTYNNPVELLKLIKEHMLNY